MKEKTADGWRRGVVFVRELVPRRALTFVANTLYGEHYQTLPMKHNWEQKDGELNVEYSWKTDRWHRFGVIAENGQLPIAVGSEEEFISEHYWGYTRINPQMTKTYEVRHPRWKVYPVQSYTVEVDFANVYGNDFAFLNSTTPYSVLLAEGSLISGGFGKTIKAPVATDRVTG
ncbi:MAG: DUF2071 domain-containing protein [Flavobacteriales bacterium]|nr:DUF2071 domain-containing protein [Flavobacteriales bacterium]